MKSFQRLTLTHQLTIMFEEMGINILEYNIYIHLRLIKNENNTKEIIKDIFPSKRFFFSDHKTLKTSNTTQRE